MNVVFVEPSFPDNQKEFVRALKEVDATVIGIGERPKDWLDGDLRQWLTHYEQVPSVVDGGRMVEAVRWLQDKVWVDRLEATVEAHVMTAAEVREACGIPGTSVRTTFLCRDKPAMKEALRAAGVPTARSTGASSGSEVRAFASEVGFPLIVKPTTGAGASGTHRVGSVDELEEAIARSHVDQGATVAVEEFVEGHEGFFDTITIDGRVVHEWVTHYYPNVLEAMRTRWISPQLVTTNRIDDVPAYGELKDFGRKVIEALEIGTSATHMEWFAGPKGLLFSEIGCRPPGVRCWDLYAAANDIDIYREWATAVVHGRPGQTLSRRFSAGMIALRPDRDGQISGYDGVDALQGRYAEWVIDAHLPPAGTATQPVEAGYMANVWVRMKHPDYDELRRMLDDVGRTLKVYAELIARRLDVPPELTADAVEALIAGRELPIVTPDACMFVYRGATDAVHLRHWGVGLPPDLGFERLAGSDLWVLRLELPRGLRVEYKFEVAEHGGVRLVEDPLNPQRANNPFGGNSVCQADGYAVPEWARPDPQAAEGTLKDHPIVSVALGRTAGVTLYLPAGFDSNPERRYPLLVVHDGGDYLHYAALKTVLDNLVHRRMMPPLVAACLHPGERLVEYADDERHARFLSDELIPELEAQLPLVAEQSGKGLMGASFGAVASLAAASRFPGRFGRLLLQSGSFAWSSNGCSSRREAIWEPIKHFVDRYAGAPARVSDRVFVTCGVYESLICENRALLPALERTGMDVRFVEALDGHNWESWRDRLGDALPWLFDGTP